MDRIEDDCVVETKLHLKQTRDLVYRKFANLCTDLKLLYVAITRPKQMLVIYDDVQASRKPLQSYWERLGVVDVLTKDMMQDQSKISADILDTFKRSLGAESDVTEWKLQGIKLFKRKFYQSAITCFRNCADEQLVTRCLAYEAADKATSMQSEADSKMLSSKN
jgi:ATP-dependent exoDNAse (exonuclease V) beta subunit